MCTFATVLSTTQITERRPYNDPAHMNPQKPSINSGFLTLNKTESKTAYQEFFPQTIPTFVTPTVFVYLDRQPEQS